jgi:hypothetical protein
MLRIPGLKFPIVLFENFVSREKFAISVFERNVISVSLPWRQVSPALNKNTYFRNVDWWQVGGRFKSHMPAICYVVSLITPDCQKHTNGIITNGERKGEK